MSSKHQKMLLVEVTVVVATIVVCNGCQVASSKKEWVAVVVSEAETETEAEAVAVVVVVVGNSSSSGSSSYC